VNIPRTSYYQRIGKRIFDLAVTTVLILLAWPLLLLIAICSLLFLGRPVLFQQMRIGLRERAFPLIKFRTMTGDCDSMHIPLPDQQRLTAFGRFLRASSLDELPQLWNVLRGDMSLVGPRPLLPEYKLRYSAFQRRRHEVKPGITGWVQVNGRNSLAWERKFELDVWYVDNCTGALDLKILWLTVVKVVRREGVNAIGAATMPEFLGTLAGEARELEQRRE
jgi:sugar transferase EpsL